MAKMYTLKKNINVSFRENFSEYSSAQQDN